MRLLELARGAHLACAWKNGELTADFRQPFDVLAATTESVARLEAAAGAKTANFENWLLFVRAFRTVCIAPSGDLRYLLDECDRLPRWPKTLAAS